MSTLHSTPHLCYADDVIFMGSWSKKNVMNLKRILRCLQLVSGLKVNLMKSSLMGVGPKEDEVHRMVGLLNYKAGSLPFLYLGLPVGENMKRIGPWRPIIDKFAKKLSNWKAKTLSMGGRITLSKAVLGNLPAYYLSIFKASVKVINSLEGIRRAFVWGKLGGKNKLQWVAWKKVQAPKNMGGLGLGEIRSLNWALLAKWKWRFRNNPTQLWTKVLRAIHGNDNSPLGIPIKRDRPGVWKDINLVYAELKKARVEITDNTGIVNNNDSIQTFSVATFRSFVAEKMGKKTEVGHFTWNRWVPNKVLLFVWRLILGSIATKAAFDHRGINLGNLECGICGGDVETVNHLTVECTLVKAVWWHVFNWIKISVSVQVSDFNGLLDEVYKQKGSKIWKKTIEVVLYAAVWRVWKSRNGKVFENIPFSVLKVVEEIKEDSYFWLKHRSPFSKLDWMRWRDFNIRDIIM
ncbi:uncharacterized protein LOC110867200 [Helianthus annuus]|uniref:uncharacterized protein LOC110867200 n=1 Tax=Helianthus annuus TaxID=4232 RepID=UPI000B901B86|nr:uncharacterized protein LOC110867200 [Helianthus annuus]